MQPKFNQKNHNKKNKDYSKNKQNFSFNYRGSRRKFNKNRWVEEKPRKPVVVIVEGPDTPRQSRSPVARAAFLMKKITAPKRTILNMRTERRLGLFNKVKAKLKLRNTPRAQARFKYRKRSNLEFQTKSFTLFRKLFSRWRSRYSKRGRKHRFYIKYFRVFFEKLTGYKELELRNIWRMISARGRANTQSGSVSPIRWFKEALWLRLDSFALFLKMAPTIMTARELAQSGVFLINGVIMFNNFYSLCVRDVFQILPDSTYSFRRSIFGWTGLRTRNFMEQFMKLRFLQMEPAIVAGQLVIWPRSYEMPATTAEPMLSERWLRFYIRFLIPAKVGKWRDAKHWWEVYKLNEKIFKRGGHIKFKGSIKYFQSKRQEIGTK